jgi:peptidoglycan-N-acetylglucosamine deacetylase
MSIVAVAESCSCERMWVSGRGSPMRKGVALAIGLLVLVLVALLRPGPVVRWLARRHPDVLFHWPNEKRLVALTIDDSPHPLQTPRILDTLAEHNAHATFFLIGERIPSNEEIVRRIVDEGHELWNHLMTNTPSIGLSPAEFERQLQQTHALLAPYGSVQWFRPGSGWYSHRMLDQLRTHGYRCAMASAYAYDPQIRSVWYVSRHILRNTRAGSVIVLHDGAACGAQTVVVLRNVLPQLQRRGYRVVTLSELAGSNEEAAHPHHPGSAVPNSSERRATAAASLVGAR